jgi:hypothetical protein
MLLAISNDNPFVKLFFIAPLDVDKIVTRSGIEGEG